MTEQLRDEVARAVHDCGVLLDADECEIVADAAIAIVVERCAQVAEPTTESTDYENQLYEDGRSDAASDIRALQEQNKESR